MEQLIQVMIEWSFALRNWVLRGGDRKHYAAHEPEAYSKLTHLTASDEMWLNAKITIYLSTGPYLRSTNPRNKTQFNGIRVNPHIISKIPTKLYTRKASLSEFS